MLIQDDITLRELQKGFSALFPGLKIEFFNEHHGVGEGSSMKTHWGPERRIGLVSNRHTEGDLRVEDSMTVREFEQRFFDRYGLNVQVFRRSGNIWIQTTATDSWTLAAQNRKGGSSEQLFNEKYNPT